ncbi:CheY-like chemotaxis protein [Paraburkholderia silvatlantica]|uniref:CheY-like chemotaxis protein n=1 Tax=Paraburkholderia silvatlantica TaxID=321895 RepID=A0ABR6FZP9_9BURK|nr:CheY-like chemotaxis protein [Paraburkholderia silvatlantica]PVY17869.1 response regulator receiver domain-containing protein [Paraburkholderia silvatlantica]PXW23781.1 response regulator receiver domain-containing protein [Paraburkholderia silvatlantica]TDQ98937.1 response regulator receiver domain-containing protein [Paraburkholderia silvatlantica]
MPTRILVVDADAGLRDPANRYLSNQSFEISILRDAGSLQHRLRRNRPDLVVLDVMTPGVGALTALRNLRAADDDIVVVILAARVDVEDRIVGPNPVRTITSANPGIPPSCWRAFSLCWVAARGNRLPRSLTRRHAWFSVASCWVS